MVYYKKNVVNDKYPFAIFLHGWGCTSSFMEPLKKNIYHYNHLFIDLPGFGLSSLDSPYFIEDYVEMLEDIVTKEKIDSFYLIGHSFGGKISLFYSLMYPNKVKGLLLIAPSIIKPFTLFTDIKIKVNKIFHKHIFKGSKDYISSSNNLRKTLVNVCRNYPPKNKIKKLKIHTYVLSFISDKEVKRKDLRKIKRINKNIHYKELNGGHFAYLSYMALIGTIMEKMI